MALFVACATFTSCSNDDDPNDPNDPNNPNTPVTPTTPTIAAALQAGATLEVGFEIEGSEPGQVYNNGVTCRNVDGKIVIEKITQNGVDITAQSVQFVGVTIEGDNIIYGGYQFTSFLFNTKNNTYSVKAERLTIKSVKVNGIEILPTMKEEGGDGPSGVTLKSFLDDDFGTLEITGILSIEDKADPTQTEQLPYTLKLCIDGPTAEVESFKIGEEEFPRDELKYRGRAGYAFIDCGEFYFYILFDDNKVALPADMTANKVIVNGTDITKSVPAVKIPTLKDLLTEGTTAEITVRNVGLQIPTTDVIKIKNDNGSIRLVSYTIDDEIQPDDQCEVDLQAFNILYIYCQYAAEMLLFCDTDEYQQSSNTVLISLVVNGIDIAPSLSKKEMN